MAFYLLACTLALILFIVVGWLYAKGPVSPAECLKRVRSVGWISLMSTFLTTQVDGSFVFLTASYATYDGIFTLLYPIGVTLGFAVLGMGAGAKIHKLNLGTVSDIFEHYYGSAFIKRLFALLTLVSIFGFLVAQVLILKGILQFVGFQKESFFIALWLLVLCLQRAVKIRAWTDWLQIIILTGTIFFLFILSPTANTTASYSPQSAFNVKTIMQSFIDNADTKICSYFLMPFLFVLMQQDIIKTTRSVRSKKEVSLAAFFSVFILLLFSLLPTYWGVLSSSACDGCASEFVKTTQAAFGPLVATVAVVVLIVNLISGALSLLKTANTTVIDEFLISQKHTVVSRETDAPWIITLLLGLSALAASYTTDDLTYKIMKSYELAVVSIFVPFAYATFFHKPNHSLQIAKVSAFCSVVSGAVSFILLHTYGWTFVPEIIALLFSWLGFLIANSFGYILLRYSENLPIASSHDTIAPYKNYTLSETITSEIKDFARRI